MAPCSAIWGLRWLSIAVVILILTVGCSASLGDRLPDFRQCVQICQAENCGSGQLSIPFYRRLLLWDCDSECDYTCQHVITDQRVSRNPPMLEPVVQFHGKWPFYRFLGVQEPFSVLFSLFNFLAHHHGIARIRESIPATYSLRKYYVLFGYVGMTSWIFSMIFHTRDFNATEKADYFAAGASVMYGMFYTPVRIFRLDRKRETLRLWTLVCIGLYAAHVAYLTLWSWDYTYNMAANVVIGLIQNVLWVGFSVSRYRKSQKTWMAWPGLIVAWIFLAMSLELADFPPWGGMIDAHSLWHLGTVIPVIWWYNFLVKDAQDDMETARLKA